MPDSLTADPGALAPARRVRRGVGLSLVYHGAGFTGSGEVKLASVAALDLAREGRPRILTANTEIGQGTVTVFCQLVAEALGVPAEFVAIETPDTGVVPDSGPTVASRTLMLVGGLLEQCAREMREKLELFAARPARDARQLAQYVMTRSLSSASETRRLGIATSTGFPSRSASTTPRAMLDMPEA